MEKIGIEGQNSVFGIIHGQLGQLLKKPSLKELNSGFQTYWEREILKNGRYDGCIKYVSLSRSHGAVWVKLVD